ncbi:MAG: GHKL domain-containing protein [Lachnospiraceae bacterium]|nr:GHKL domain-containing protein [Lachnospiraceae bacterium]
MSALATNIINNIFHVIWFCYITLEPKHSLKRRVFITCAGAVFYQILMIVLMHSGIAGKMLYLVAYLLAVVIFGGVFLIFLSASHPAKSLFLVSVYFCLWTFIYGVISIVTKTKAGAGNMEIWALRIGLNLAFLFAYQFFFRKKLSEIYQKMKKDYGMVSSLSFLSFFMLTLLLIYNQSHSKWELSQVFMMALIYGSMLIVYVVLFRYIVLFDYRDKVDQMRKQEKYLQDQIDSYKKIEREARQTRHDFRHHNLVIIELIRKRDYEGVLDYLEEYESKEEEKIGRNFCNDHAVNSLLTAYLRKAQQNGILVETEIQFWETFQISDFDLVTILANILENAINGCMQVEGERKIKIVIRQKGAKLILVCNNTCINPVPFKNGLPKSSRQKSVGVESILHSAEKYCGDVDFSASEGIFTCKVILNNKGNEKEAELTERKESRTKGSMKGAKGSKKLF